jgi:hypothetical protein
MQGGIMNKEQALAFIDLHRSYFKKPKQWFEDNWHVVEAFENSALNIIAKGRSHYSARTIVEVLVHESIIAEKDGQFKIGNDNAPDLARVFVVLHPEQKNFWEYRRPDSKEFVALFN